MKGIKKSTLEELGYKEYGKLDLVNNKKDAIYVNVLSLVVLVAMVALIPLFVKGTIEEFILYFNPLHSIVLLIMIILYIPLHELVHGAFMKSFSGEKLSFGWKLVYAYCGSKEGMVNYPEYSTVALAPLIVFSIVFIAMMVLMPSWALVWYLMEVVNVSGSAGDIYVTLKLWKDRKKDILVNDTGTEMTIYKRV